MKIINYFFMRNERLIPREVYLFMPSTIVRQSIYLGEHP